MGIVTNSADDRRVLQLQQQIQELTDAAASNRITSTALGMVMERHHLDREQAFAWLVRESQDSNTKLLTVALNLIVRAEEADPRPYAP
jgi:AmiR/NasT family two-component response regulator